MVRKSGVSALLWYVMRGTSLRLHSRAEQVLRLLMDSSIISIGEEFSEGSDTAVEVVIAAFQRLCEALEPIELKLMWDCLYEEITDCVNNGYLLHVSRLLSLLISTVQIEYVRKISDYQPVLQLVGLLVQTFIMPSRVVTAEDQSSEIIEKVLQLMLCILDGLQSANNMSAFSNLSVQWAPVFELRNSRSLLTFIGELLLKDPCILHTFRTNIISGLNHLIESFEEGVIHLLQIFCERLQVQSSGPLDGTSKAGLSRICSYFEEAIANWIGVINDAAQGDPSHVHFQETKLALLWGIINCYVVDVQANPSLLMHLVDALDQLLTIESGFPKNTWQSLIGAALSSYNKLRSAQKSGDEESAVCKFLYLAKRYKSSSQILSSVADFLDSVDESMMQADVGPEMFHPELGSRNVVDALDIFTENLCHPDKRIRLSTLRILCHYEPLSCEYRTKDQPVEKKLRTEISQTCQDKTVFQLLLSIESTPLSISTSREIISLISRIQMDISATRIPETYVPSVLHGIFGIFHNKFECLWDPAMQCLAVLIGQYFGLIWGKCAQYLEQCESIFFTSQNKSDGGRTEQLHQSGDLVERFKLFVDPPSVSTQCADVLSYLVQSLKKVPSVSESGSRQIIPLFLKFLGYEVDDIVSVESYNSQVCKGKEWKNILKKWLDLLNLMQNPKSFYRSQFLKEVLQYRFLDDSDATLQEKVLDCLLNWKDDFLIPYDQHLKNLIIAKNLREELTTWNLSRESNLIDEGHRIYLVPIVIRILISKIRNLKTLAPRKRKSIHHRRAVLRFLAQLEVGELPPFFALLMKPLQSISQGVDLTGNWHWSPPGRSENEFDSSKVLKHFTMDNINAHSWKTRYGFLHVIEDIILVFDELHISSFLDLLMGSVVRILVSCTSTLDRTKSNGLSSEENDSSFNLTVMEKEGGVMNDIMTSKAMKQFKDMRSLCLKIISLVLSKYEDHDFDSEFWDLFFMSVKPLVEGFKQECASSEKPSSLFSCFLAMSRSYKLVPLLYRDKNLVPDIFSILTVTTASEAIVSCVLKFIENLLHLESELDNEDNSIKGVLLPNLDALVSGLHRLFTCDNATKRYKDCPMICLSVAQM
ncbi:unnamed protein product [Ilex paraguariensis]|uniref:U3 small nucleolar RNA-associated protein 20 N-terminal domain-containing protein n=1 Tax=Ilex paraguariensis TaxID=185542 RepID=A0ABC8QY13_9AQUA